MKNWIKRQYLAFMSGYIAGVMGLECSNRKPVTMNWIKRQYLAFMSGYNVYRLTLTSFKGGFDPRPMLIDALEASMEAEEDAEEDEFFATLDKMLKDTPNIPTMDELGLRGRSTRH